MTRSITQTIVVAGVAVVAGLAVAGTAQAAGPSAGTTPVATPHTSAPHKTAKPKTAVKPKVHRFPAKHAHVQLHAKPSQASPVVGTMVRAGSEVTVRCYTTGTAVSGDRVWYRTAKTTSAEYVAGADLRSGHDPAAGVPRC